MPQSLANVLLHVVFSTKGREPVLAKAWRPELEAYLAGILRRLDCPAVQVGGRPEHVHQPFGGGNTRAASIKYFRPSRPR